LAAHPSTVIRFRSSRSAIHFASTRFALESGAVAEPIQRAAHAFKSAAATIGARALATLLEQIEAAAREGDVAAAQDTLERVRGEAHAALEYLQTTVKGGRDG
jgi:HPt (histidine-containing phosphotransfer) domain-containing protein